MTFAKLLVSKLYMTLAKLLVSKFYLTTFGSPSLFADLELSYHKQGAVSCFVC